MSVDIRVVADAAAARDPQGAAIIRQIWVAGIIPFFVGLALIFNAVVVNKMVRRGQAAARGLGEPVTGAGRSTTSDLPALAAPPEPVSVTEHTTDLLREPAPAARHESESRPAARNVN